MSSFEQCFELSESDFVEICARTVSLPLHLKNSLSLLHKAFDTMATMKIKESDADGWYCHCCSAKNVYSVKKCRVCGRPDSYALSGYPLPFHGENAKIFRSSQVINVLDDIHAVDSEGWTSLHSACASGNLDIVRALIEYKSQLEALNNKGQTALHLAVYSSSPECVLELLRANANVNVATLHERTTPLHMACEMGLARITHMLLQHGANVHMTNILERTPLHCAAISGRTDIALMLLSGGAKLKALDAHGWEACQIAELFGHRDFQEFLIRHNMTEKQAVIKDLPPAKWHSAVWNEVVDMHKSKRIEHSRQQEQQRLEDERLAAIREAARREDKRKKMEERKALTVLMPAAYQIVKRGPVTINDQALTDIPR